ncbi:MAG: cyclic nucleotide-binding domain-containing protein [Chloroflexi bacterium]|nr:cyclic nucleotide-binding domain-containing protein [Chloroflexota bacterium]
MEGGPIGDTPARGGFFASPLFRGVPADRLPDLAASFEARTLASDAIVVREGEPGDALFVVETGLVEVFLARPGGEEVVLSRLGPGEAFGEMSVLTGEPRSAAVRTVRPTTVRVVTREQFLRLAADLPLLLFNLSRTLVGRLSQASRAAARVQGCEVVAIVGRVPPLVGSLIATNLAAALSWTTRERVLLVDRPPGQASWLPGREQAPALADVWSAGAEGLSVRAFQFGGARLRIVSLPEDGGFLAATRPVSLPEAFAWLRHNARFVVLNLAGEDRGDLETLLSQVDRTYLLVTARQLETPFAGEIVAAFHAARPEVQQRSYPIVISGEGLSLSELRRRTMRRLGMPARSIVPGLAQILKDAARNQAPLAIEARHLSFSRAMHWLARDVAGLKVGVALGAGGARGFAHVGVFSFLEEHDIPNDFLAGTSMGSVIAAPKALGMDVAQGRETMLRLHEKFTSLIRPTFSLMASLLSPKGVEDTYRELVGDANLEELPVPFAVVAADLETARPIVLTEGSLADAMRASSAIPLVWPPKVIGKYRLVDGAVLNPVPTQPVRDLGADIVIAVDLSARSEPGADGARGERHPNIFQNVFRCIDIMTADRAVRDCLLADVVIRPRFELTGWKHFDQADAYAAAGYQAAEEMLPALRKVLPWLDRAGA